MHRLNALGLDNCRIELAKRLEPVALIFLLCLDVDVRGYVNQNVSESKDLANLIN